MNVSAKPDAMSTWDGVLDLNEQDVLKEDCRFQAGMSLYSQDNIWLAFMSYVELSKIIFNLISILQEIIARLT